MMFALSNTIVIISRRMRGMGHVAHKGRITRFWWSNLKESDHLKDLGIHERTILKCIFKM
jgi:hypothetical protein